jgi:hypothetical protein
VLEDVVDEEVVVGACDLEVASTLVEDSNLVDDSDLIVVLGLELSLSPLQGPPVLGSRYQFDEGSPRQSPMVVNWYPFSFATSIMYWTNPSAVKGWMSWAREIHLSVVGLLALMIPE